MSQPTAYPATFREIPIRFGHGWTRFWFTPSDPIVLSLVRILIALVGLWWYLSYLPVLQDWFGPEGIFSLNMSLALREKMGGTAISLLDLAHTASQLWLIYFLGVAALVMMLLGLFTRFATIASLLVVLSFNHRAPMLIRYVDNILPMLMFYLCIGPAGANFSIDQCWRQWRRRKRLGTVAPEPDTIRYSSAATVAIRLMQVHLALIYGGMLVAQLQGQVWWQGTAVWWMIARPESRLVDLTFLTGMGSQQLEYLMNVCTYAILLYELCFATLIWNPLARPILLILGFFIWGGLALVSGSVSFAVLMFVGNLAFLPSETLRRWCGSCPVV
jgi:hypothetical protein